MKTAELTGAALNWAVALIEFPEPDYENDDRLVYVHGDDEFHFTPSTDWAQGGPIIERACIDLEWTGIPNADFFCTIQGKYEAHGTTPLVAAMRCYVASKLGDKVEIPEELLCCAHD
jgi:hypothetical protein